MKKLLKPVLASILMAQVLTSTSHASENSDTFITKEGLNTNLEYTCAPLKTQMDQRAVFNLENQTTLRFFRISHIQDSLLTSVLTKTPKGQEDFKAILFVSENGEGQRSGGIILDQLEKVQNFSQLRVGVGISKRLGEKYIDLLPFSKVEKYSEPVEPMLLSTPVESLLNIEKSKSPFEGIYRIDAQSHSGLIEQCIKSESEGN